ncbi:hypothetical protein BP6252_00363 [Coleophoma cylindrospora]|uniref:Uncharacterized protein n=1 Tax=Coleophoma cylindrospora TaxID=1849047 RepID=A0A3D8SQ87_9HELO|nr:hypothetical protein BP6252_00363 [Coleophoma cylindrospora]
MSQQFHNMPTQGQPGADPTSQQESKRSKRGREAMAASHINREENYRIRKEILHRKMEILRRKMETAKRQHIYFHDEDFQDVNTNDFTDEFQGFGSDHNATEKPNDEQTGPTKALEEADIKNSDKSSRREKLLAQGKKRRAKKRNARTKHLLEKYSNKGAGGSNSQSIKPEANSHSKHKSKEILASPEVQADNAATQSEDIKGLMTASPLGKYHDALIASIKRGKSSTSPQLATQASDTNTGNPDSQMKEIESKAAQAASNGRRSSKSHERVKGDTSSATQSIHDKEIKEEKNDTSEGWETTGRFRRHVKKDPNASDDEEIVESLAFSSHHLLEQPKGVNIDGLNFQVQRILTNTSHVSTPGSRRMQICSVVQGKVNVTLCGEKFTLEENGMWRVKAGEKCVARNVDDTDAVIHITTVNYWLRR